MKFEGNFDQIILSPGIDINKCKLSKFLKKNHSKIYSDLDVFYSFYKNECITITGTNGKSTTCQLMYQVLLNQKHDVKLVGNIGNPILSVKNFKKKKFKKINISNLKANISNKKIKQNIKGNTNAVYVNPLNSLRFVLNKIKKDKTNLGKDFYVFTGSTVGVVPILGKGLYTGKIEKLGSVKAIIS